jgi:hypothetical protein
MGWQIKTSFETSANKAVLRYLAEKAPSAHSDLAETLRLASQGVPGARLYCPDKAKYAFFAVYRPDYTIVALAVGMKQLVFRLPAALVANALQEGAIPFPEIGSEWVCFAPFPNDESQTGSLQSLGRWCRKATLSWVGD